MMVNKRSLLLGGAVTAIAALSLTACGGSNSSAPQPSETPAQSSPAAAEAGSLTVWVDANREPVLKDAAADFQAKSGVKVDLVIKDFSKIQEDFLKQVPTGKGPDITIGAHDWLGNLVNNGVVQPVELGDKSADFQDVAIDAMSYEGNTYGVPYATENLALLRNKDLADKAPATFDEMIAEGKKAGTDFPFLVQVSELGDPFHAYPFQTSFDAPVFGTDENGAYDPSDLRIGNEGGLEFAHPAIVSSLILIATFPSRNPRPSRVPAPGPRWQCFPPFPWIINNRQVSGNFFPAPTKIGARFPPSTPRGPRHGRHRPLLRGSLRGGQVR